MIKQKRDNYRSIILVNINSKRLNKTLPKITDIKKSIHHEQAGFIPKIHRWFYIYKDINVVSHINGLKDKRNPQLTGSKHRKS